MLVFFFGHVDEWALDDFSAHLNGTFVCSSTAYFHVTFMNRRYVQIEVCYKHRNSHISGMRNGLLTSFFSFFVQGVRLASPSSLLPAEPFSKGLVLYVCFAHLIYVNDTNRFLAYMLCSPWHENTESVCVGIAGHVIFGAIDIITFDTTTLRV